MRILVMLLVHSPDATASMTGLYDLPEIPREGDMLILTPGIGADVQGRAAFHLAPPREYVVSIDATAHVDDTPDAVEELRAARWDG